MGSTLLWQYPSLPLTALRANRTCLGRGALVSMRSLWGPARKGFSLQQVQRAQEGAEGTTWKSAGDKLLPAQHKRPVCQFPEGSWRSTLGILPRPSPGPASNGSSFLPLSSSCLEVTPWPHLLLNFFTLVFTDFSRVGLTLFQEASASQSAPIHHLQLPSSLPILVPFLSPLPLPFSIAK